MTQVRTPPALPLPLLLPPLQPHTPSLPPMKGTVEMLNIGGMGLTGSLPQCLFDKNSTVYQVCGCEHMGTCSCVRVSECVCVWGGGGGGGGSWRPGWGAARTRTHVHAYTRCPAMASPSPPARAHARLCPCCHRSSWGATPLGAKSPTPLPPPTGYSIWALARREHIACSVHACSVPPPPRAPPVTRLPIVAARSAPRTCLTPPPTPPPFNACRTS